jgi:hypothetical protein
MAEAESTEEKQESGTANGVEVKNEPEVEMTTVADLSDGELLMWCQGQIRLMICGYTPIQST